MRYRQWRVWIRWWIWRFSTSDRTESRRSAVSHRTFSTFSISTAGWRHRPPYC